MQLEGGDSAAAAPDAAPALPVPEPCASPGAARWLGRERDVFWLRGNVVSSSCRAKNQKQASGEVCLSPMCRLATPLQFL